MKNLLKIIVGLLCLFSACSTDDVIVDDSCVRPIAKMCPANKGDSLLVLLNRVSDCYQGSAVMINNHEEGLQVCTSGSDPVDGTSGGEQSENQGNNEVFECDALGFAVGFTFAGNEGALVGTILSPGVGTIAGAIMDKLMVGIVTGMVASLTAANNANLEASLEQSNEGDMDYWIHDFSDSFLFSEDVLGANVGYYHNWLISNLWIEHGNNIRSMETDDILMYAVDLLERGEIVQFNDAPMFNAEVSSLCDGFQDFEGISFMNIPEENRDVIFLYLTELTTILPNNRQQFTSDFMDVIAGYGLSEENTILLNGMISTYYYSSLLWNIDAIYLQNHY